MPSILAMSTRPELALNVQRVLELWNSTPIELRPMNSPCDVTAGSKGRNVPQEMEGAVASELTGRILVIDDDPHFLRVLSRILSGESFQVNAAASVPEAVELLRSNTFDVIISDLRMPESDGLTLLQTVRKTGNEVPVIMLTAYGEVDSYLEAMNAGANEYLNKPIKSDELVKVVRSCLQARNARQATGRPKSP
jgi:two-component system response regulator (stage 0 sporulation protein F)